MARFAPLGDSTIEVIRAARLAGLVADVQPLVSATESAVAGASGRYADAAHQHPAKITDLINQAVLEIVGATGGISDALVEFNIAPSATAYIGSPGSAGRLIPSSVSGDLLFRVGSGQAFRWSGDGGGSELLRLTQNALQLMAGARLGAGIAPLDQLHLYGASPWIRTDDSSGGAAKAWRIGSGLITPGNLGFYDQTDGLSILDLDPAGNVYVKQPTAVLRFQDNSATPLKYIQALSGTLLFSSNEGLAMQQITDAGVVIVNPRSLTTGAAGLQVHPSGAVIPAIFVQAATPTEIDGALWFQG